MNAAGELVHDLPSVVTVPHSGWYGFCLQVQRGDPCVLDELQRQQDHASAEPFVVVDPSKSSTEDPPTAHDDDDCESPCCNAGGKEDGTQGQGTDSSTHSLELCVEAAVSSASPPSTDQTLAGGTASSYPLPFVHEGVELDQSLRIGKVVFLERDATVQVKHRMTTIGDAVRVKRGVVVLQWRLVPHHLAKDAAHQQASKEKEDKDDDAVERMFRQPKKKTLICAECRRGFVTLRDISTHLQSRHSQAVDGSAAIEAGITLVGSIRNVNDGTTMSTTTSSSIWTRPLTVVYNDDVMSVVVKPQGMPVMGSSPSLIRSDLLVPFLRMAPVAPECCRHSRKRPAAMASPSPPLCTAQRDGNDSAPSGGGGVGFVGVDKDGKRGALLRKPRPAHRLDSGTGGLLVIAKTLEAEAALKRSFANGQARKTYVALVIGKLLSHRHPKQEGECGVVDAPLSGKLCRTLFRTLHVVPSATFGFLTKVELRPETGRKHQLRRHMQLLGHSIVGDVRYITTHSVSYRSLPKHLFEADIGPYSRLCLWAGRVRLPHPTLRRHPAEVECSLPEPIQWLEFVLQYEREQMEVNSSTASDGLLST
jgi:23S rRNA-/tRNA-specific pseudouridylate synthase